MGRLIIPILTKTQYKLLDKTDIKLRRHDENR